MFMVELLTMAENRTNLEVLQDEWTKRMWYTYKAEFLCSHKEWDHGICRKIDATGDYYVKLIKPDLERQIQHFLLCADPRFKIIYVCIYERKVKKYEGGHERDRKDLKDEKWDSEIHVGGRTKERRTEGIIWGKGCGRGQQVSRGTTCLSLNKWLVSMASISMA